MNFAQLLFGFSTKMDTTVGERITQARAARGLSQGELARESGIASTQLSRYETGRARPRKLALARLAQALAISLRWLETGEGGMEEYPQQPGDGLTFTIDEELADRLRAYCLFNGLSLAEAIADILDTPLAVYSEELLPTAAVDRSRLKEILRSGRGPKSSRLKAVARQVHIKS